MYQEYTNDIFKGTGLRWISGYFLPDSIINQPDKIIYVAQLGLDNNNQLEHNPITTCNLSIWLENDPVGQKVKIITSNLKLSCVFQMPPHQPGYALLNVFFTFNDD